MNEVPLYLGEGPDRKLIGTAKIQGATVSCNIVDEVTREYLSKGLTYSFGFIPEGMTIDRVILRDLAKEELPKPIYKELPSG